MEVSVDDIVSKLMLPECQKYSVSSGQYSKYIDQLDSLKKRIIQLTFKVSLILDIKSTDDPFEYHPIYGLLNIVRITLRQDKYSVFLLSEYGVHILNVINKVEDKKEYDLIWDTLVRSYQNSKPELIDLNELFKKRVRTEL